MYVSLGSIPQGAILLPSLLDLNIPQMTHDKEGTVLLFVSSFLVTRARPCQPAGRREGRQSANATRLHPLLALVHAPSLAHDAQCCGKLKEQLQRDIGDE
ncbi:AAI domain-containing protein [Psidium guajava]|nr:AAI domain-containing protein [Psidium guajava]